MTADVFSMNKVPPRESTPGIESTSQISCFCGDQVTSSIQNSMQLALNGMSQGLLLFGADETIIFSNSRMCEILRIPPSAVNPGNTFRGFLHAVYSHPQLNEDAVTLRVQEVRSRHFESLTRQGGSFTAEREVNGQFLALSHRLLKDGGWVSTIEDISDRKKLESQLTFLAEHEPLTEMPNRATLQKKLAAHISIDTPCALLYIDLDRFKPINDTLGHPVGDHVLKVVAKRITRLLGQEDSGARIGGDEFAVILGGCETYERAAKVADQLLKEISMPIPYKGAELYVGASIGIAFSKDCFRNADTLTRNADLALYVAKEAGKGCHREYISGMEDELHARLGLERELREALAKGEFHLHYQPVVDIGKNIVTSFEALLRWRSSTRGEVSPADFIPFAEEVGLMVEIGDFVLRSACAEAASWTDQNVCVSVNLSASQFNSPNLTKRIMSIVRQSGLAPNRLELEITETAMITDIARAQEVLIGLRSEGVQVALDDFGIGYSSLSFVKNLPFTRIKIDRSFVQELGSKPESLAIVRAISGLCDGLNVSVTAEGVENVQQLEVLKREGCLELQGFYIQRPCSPSAAQDWLADYKLTRTVGPELLKQCA